MTKKIWQKRLLCIAVAVAMAVMLIPVTAFADGDVAEVDGTGYATLQEAINNGNGKTVTLLAATTENIVVEDGTAVTLDLGAFTITNDGSGHTITNRGTLTIQGRGTVDNVNHACAALWNEGTAVLNGGTFNRSQETGSSADVSGSNSYYTVVNHGTMTINDGVTVTQNGKFSSLLENGWYDGTQNTSAADSVLTIEGGTFSGGLNTIKNDDYGVLYINGGSFENVAQAALLNWNEAEISGGTFTADETSSCVVLNGYINDTMDAGTLKITGGTFTGGEGTDALNTMGGSYNSGAIEISGGEFNGDIVLGNGNRSSGTLSISGDAVVNGNISNTNSDAITVTGGTITGTVSNTGTGTTEISGGEFTVQPSSDLISDGAAVAGYTASGAAAATYYVGADIIAAAAQNAETGDSIEILSGDVDLTIVNGGVTVTNSGDGSVTVNDTDVPADGSTTTHVHKYATEYDENGHWQECECGDKTEVESHDFGEWVVDTEATETEEGTQHRECTVCGYVENGTIPATGSTSSDNDSVSSGDGTSSGSSASSSDSTSSVTSSQTSSVAQVDTGDGMNVAVFVMIALLGVAGAATFLVTQRKKTVSKK